MEVQLPTNVVLFFHRPFLQGLACGFFFSGLYMAFNSVPQNSRCHRSNCLSGSFQDPALSEWENKSPNSSSFGKGGGISQHRTSSFPRGSLSASPTSMTLCLQGRWEAKNLQTGFPSPLCKTYSVCSTFCLRVWRYLKQLLHSSTVIVTSNNPEIQSYSHLLLHVAGTWSLSLTSPDL